MIYTFHGSPGVPPKASVFRFRHLSSQPRSVCLLALPCLASRVLGEWPMRLISFGSVCLVAFPVLQRAPPSPASRCQHHRRRHIRRARFIMQNTACCRQANEAHSTLDQMRQGCGQGRMANCQRGIFDKLQPSRSPGATAAVEAESPQSACTQTIIFNIYGDANAQTVPHSVAPLHSLHPFALLRLVRRMATTNIELSAGLANKSAWKNLPTLPRQDEVRMRTPLSTPSTGFSFYIHESPSPPAVVCLLVIIIHQTCAQNKLRSSKVSQLVIYPIHTLRHALYIYVHRSVHVYGQVGSSSLAGNCIFACMQIKLQRRQQRRENFY